MFFHPVYLIQSNSLPLQKTPEIAPIDHDTTYMQMTPSYSELDGIDPMEDFILETEEDYLSRDHHRYTRPKKVRSNSLHLMHF